MRQDKRLLNRRFFFLALFFLALFILLTISMYDLTVEKNTAYTAALKSTSIVTTYQAGLRGTIADCNNNVLAYDEPTYDVVFYRDPDKVSASDSARNTNSLITAIGIIEDGGGTVLNDFYIVMNSDGTYRFDFGTTSEKAAAARKKNFVDACRFTDPDISAAHAYEILRESWQIPDEMSFSEASKIMSIRQNAVLNSWKAYEGVVIANNVPLSVVTELDMRATDLIGIETRMAGNRIYPYKNTACHIIGYLSRQVNSDMSSIGYSYENYFEGITTQPKTENMLELGYTYADKIGVAGVEKSCEGYLTGNLIERKGSRLIEKSKTGSIVEILNTVQPQGGKNVELSIDIELQQVVEQALRDNIAATQLEEQELIKKDHEKYEKLRSDISTIATAETGAIVVMGVNTGKVLAMASYPDYDLNMFSDGIDDAEFELLFGDDSNLPTLNRAIAIRTAPGSVFKMATGFAGLMEEKITPTTTISDKSPYYYFVDDPTTKVEANAPSCWISNPAYHSNLNIARALAVSCNYFFFTVADRVGIEKLKYWSGRLGLEGTTGIELPGELSVQIGGQSDRYDYTRSLGEQSSSIPRIIYNQIRKHLDNIKAQAGIDATKEQLDRCAMRLLELQDGKQTEHGEDIRRILYEELNIPVGVSYQHASWVVNISIWLEELRWKPTYTIQSGIGQGVMLLTPISVARYICTIANRGTVYKASLLNAVYNSDGSLYKSIEPEIVSIVDAPEEYWDILYEGMADVVSAEEGGTASQVFSDTFTRKYLKDIVGKTGTAQTANSSGNIDIENTAWIVCVTPKDEPEIAIVVYIPNGLAGHSNSVAVEKIVTWWMENRA